jgi:drug/metabolite transporter (DMT)-like permease
VAAGRRPLPRRWVVWGQLALVAVLLCALPFTLFAFAETRISSGLTSIWNATTPLLTLMVALALLPTERLTRTKVTGLLVGAVGVLVVLEFWTVVGARPSGEATADLVAQLACLGATSCYAMAFVLLRRVMARGLDPLGVAFAHVALAAALMVALAPVVSWTPMTLSLPVMAALVPLGVLGTGLAYLWNARIVRGLGATTASTVTYLTPLVGVLLGVLVLGERPAWHHLVGAVLVVAGIAIGQGRLLTCLRSCRP